jgi:hypothetical protein
VSNEPPDFAALIADCDAACNAVVAAATVVTTAANTGADNDALRALPAWRAFEDALAAWHAADLALAAAKDSEGARE